MKVADVIKQKAGGVETIEATETLQRAIGRFTSVPVRGLVVTEGGAVVGMLTMRDILRLAGTGNDALQRPVRDAMTPDVATVSSGAALDEVEKVIVSRRVNHVPVVDDGKLVGIVTLADILRTHLDKVATLNVDLRKYIHGDYAL